MLTEAIPNANEDGDLLHRTLDPSEDKWRTPERVLQDQEVNAEDLGGSLGESHLALDEIPGPVDKNTVQDELLLPETILGISTNGKPDGRGPIPESTPSPEDRNLAEGDGSTPHSSLQDRKVGNDEELAGVLRERKLAVWTSGKRWKMERSPPARNWKPPPRSCRNGLKREPSPRQ